MPEPTMEKKKKEIIKLFKDLGLQIEISTNLKQVDYLDITMNLDKEIFWPYKKPNNQIL